MSDSTADLVFELSCLYAGELPAPGRSIGEIEWQLQRLGMTQRELADIKLNAKIGKVTKAVLQFFGFGNLRRRLTAKFLNL